MANMRYTVYHPKEKQLVFPDIKLYYNWDYLLDRYSIISFYISSYFLSEIIFLDSQ